ncbi:Gfo/Idh/MocA family oxidoreductase [Amnibacterium sp.]|uniref:Gfo/Idh/MocA family protein n=1 Tax=Amnibacterium sp. TaxID=1872496 RepID=UPI002613EDA1|nr:Gfo/Idh/MocA family oxidoreductase [Amnibacterium sp.]MCU1472053.1 oxidoreductase [Amnibacterium sp.]
MHEDPEAGEACARDARVVGIAGVWHVHAADYVAELLERTDVRIRGVWDRRPAAARAFAEPRGLRWVDDLDGLLEDPSVDAVVVTTATADHPDVIARALRAGKDVFSEKVLAIRLEDALALEALASQLDRVLFVSFQRLAEPWVRTLDGVVRSGRLGRIMSSRFRFQHAGAAAGWLPAGFLSGQEAGGGAVIDLGVHGLYLSQLMNGAFPVSVSSRVSHLTGSAVEDDSVVILEYGNGSRSVLETSLVTAPDDVRWAEVHGTEGSAYISPEDLTVRVRRGDETTWAVQQPSEPWPRPLEVFLGTDAGGPDQARNRADSLRMVALVSAAYASAASGKAVRVTDPSRITAVPGDGSAPA